MTEPDLSKRKKRPMATSKKTTEEPKTRKPRETKEKSPTRQAADAFDKVRTLQQKEKQLIDDTVAKNRAKIQSVVDELSPEAREIYDKL